MKYAIVDLANLFFRARHVASKNSDAWERLGTAINICLMSMNQTVRKFGVDHVVVATEGRSWRKDFYKPYKANRTYNEAEMTEAEIEDNKAFWETYDNFITFLREKTNLSVIRCPNAEADDVIARFIKLHPDDFHYIISTDSDFVQLIGDNVSQYNGVTNQLITKDGYFDDRGRKVIDKKTNQHKLLEDVEYLLFKKIIRGDATDNVFSAYPGVREKGSKKTIGIKDAFDDRNKQGFHWNNFLLQKWSDHNGNEHCVREDYERNKTLIDLNAQPQEIKNDVDKSIVEGINIQSVGQVGFYLMKFCAVYELEKISDQIDTYAKWLSFPYTGNLKSETIS